jgi:hypothetical protein
MTRSCCRPCIASKRSCGSTRTATTRGSDALPKGKPAAIQSRSVANSADSAAMRTPPPCGTWPDTLRSNRLWSGAAGKTRRPRPSFVSAA